MRVLLILLIGMTVSSYTRAASELDGLVFIDHAWVHGYYSNRVDLPGWGVFVDVQEDTLFGAVYGYLDGTPTFVVFVGKVESLSPLTYEGDVYYVITPGVEEELVGTFTWVQGEYRSAPAASLSITSNILNVNNQLLTRGRFVENDIIDMITGGDWNVIRRSEGLTYGDLYNISDERFDQDGITFAIVSDLGYPEFSGVVGYFPDEDGNFFSMLVEFDQTTDVFYAFFANATDMYGRYWFLEGDELPSGDGEEFRGAVNSLQESFQETPGLQSGKSKPTVSTTEVVTASPNAQANPHVSPARAELRQFERSTYTDTVQSAGAMFPESTLRSVHESLKFQMGIRKSLAPKYQDRTPATQ